MRSLIREPARASDFRRCHRREVGKEREGGRAVWRTRVSGIMMYRCIVLLAGSGLVAGFHVPVPARLVPRMSRTQRTLSMSTAGREALGTVATAGSEDILQWNKQWYPVLSLKDTDAGRAHAVQVSCVYVHMLWRVAGR